MGDHQKDPEPAAPDTEATGPASGAREDSHGVWEEGLELLRRQFITGLTERLDRAARQIRRLAGLPEDTGALRDLLRTFHALAGAAATYGFPGIADLARAGEEECEALLETTRAPTRSDLARWDAVLAALRQEAERSVSGAEKRRPTTPTRVIRSHDVLVVSDSESARTELDLVLRQEGMLVRFAASRAEAIEAVDLRRPDGILIDLPVPDGSAFELVEQIRRMRSGDHPVVLMLGDRSRLVDKVETIHCGADGYFERPIDHSAILRRLQFLLERHAVLPGRILSIEDDPAQAAFLRAVLEPAGYVVQVCDNPDEFDSLLPSFRPDLVLMDVLLPGVTGFDLVRYLRQDDKYAALPVLFLTTRGQVEFRLEGTRAGGDDYLVKPVPPALLLATVAARLERARLVRGLLHQDGLTRLLTHTAFLERASAAVAAYSRDPSRTCCWIMLDLDHFKTVNDRFGHPAGDLVLVSLASLLRRRLRQTDVLGRYGGEEFGILIDDLPEPDAARLTTRLLEEFRRIGHQIPDGPTIHVTFSAGVAALNESCRSLEAWRKAADDALYAAKAAGRNRIVTAQDANP